MTGDWRLLAGGTFWMGAPGGDPCSGFNEDQHQVTLKHPFEIQVTEVTQGQFSLLMGYQPQVWSPCGSDCPVAAVTWHEAAAYCNALSAKTGRPACYACSGSSSAVSCTAAAPYGGQQVYSCPGYRLPTDAEWEYAYRAGTQTPYYSGTNDGTACSSCSKLDANADKIGWYCAHGKGMQPSRLKQPNAWGLYDMAGNVWEWCHDWFQGGLGSSSMVDPWGPPNGTERVMRGGSWVNVAASMRASARANLEPSGSGTDIGFRCVRSTL